MPLAGYAMHDAIDSDYPALPPDFTAIVYNQPRIILFIEYTLRDYPALLLSTQSHDILLWY